MGERTVLVGILLGTLSLLAGQSIGALTVPNPSLTPGFLCTPTDPNFQGYDYPEHVARCNRNIALPEKQEVAKDYGNIPSSAWSGYEFDHLIPLCAGGSDDIKNIWPQPIAEAHQKDTLENDICIAMKAGTLKQADAVQKVHDWFTTNNPAAAAALEQLMNGDASPESPRSVICHGAMSTGESGSLVLHFDIVDGAHIQNVRLALKEDTQNDVASSGTSILAGKSTRSKNAPLAGLYLYPLRDGNDHFDIYLPADLEQDSLTEAFVKVSFAGDYPELKKLQCGN